MSHRRTAVIAPLLGLALVAGAATSSAAPTKVPQVKDAVGDAVGMQAGTDLVSVLYTTSGKGSGKGYVAKQLSVTLTLGGAALGPGTTYEVEAATSDCGDVAFTYEPGTVYGEALGLTGWADWGDCFTDNGPDGVELLAPKVSGSTITWTFSLKSTPFKVGTVFTDFRARVDPSNPVVPFPSSVTNTELGLIDSATGKGTWKLG